MSSQEESGDNVYRIPSDNIWANAWKLAAVLAVIGGGLCAAGASMDPARFAHSWLFAFFAFLTFALGAVFFVLIQHLTTSGWSVTMRRTAEFFAAGIPVFALLFVPVAMNAELLYEWVGHEPAGAHGAEGEGHDGEEGEAAHEGEEHTDNGEALLGASTAQAQEHGADDGHGHAPAADSHGEAEGHSAHHTPQHTLHTELLDHKHGYLKMGGAFGWITRALLYFLIWTLLGLFYFRKSTQQDVDKDMAHTRLMQSAAPVALILFATSLTFAAFDWVMSLEPTWYSTIYGVYIFGGAAITIHALVIIVPIGLKSQGLVGNAINTEHFHELGKMLFGFIVFHAYVGFSQMMLQWYANIPEEIVYYQARWHAEGWRGVSYFLIFGHFVLPFLFLISRVIKRRLPLLAFGAMWMLIMQIADIYWFVMPNASPTLAFHWLDIAALLAVGGTYFGVVFFLMRGYPLIPIGDPRLSRGLSHVNV